MSQQYITSQDDVLDAICYQHYGREDAVVAVLAANPALCEQPEKMPAGVVITLPTLVQDAVKTNRTLSLWD